MRSMTTFFFPPLSRPKAIHLFARIL